MSRIDAYRDELRAQPEWDEFLLANSGLPGPRANLELIAAVAEEADEPQLLRLVDSGEEYLVCCGTVGLGRLVAEGRAEHLARLRELAESDSWRVREAVAMALQRWGDADLVGMLEEAEQWAASGAPLVQRAAIAGVCEPRLLRDPAAARRALALLEHVTATLPDSRDRTLRKALGYCWSVAVAALPGEGLPRFKALEASDDSDVGWVVAENLRKTRLKRLL